MSRSSPVLAAPVKRDAVAAARLDVAVQAVVGDVQLAADEPLVERRVGVVEHRAPTAETSAAARPARPTTPAGRAPPARTRSGSASSACSRNSRGGAKRLDVEQLARARGRAPRRSAPPVRLAIARPRSLARGSLSGADAALAPALAPEPALRAIGSGAGSPLARDVASVAAPLLLRAWSRTLAACEGHGRASPVGPCRRLAVGPACP